ncbi:MAG: hypothetical protein R2880_20075 [Deinococcales bacterium]
MLGTEHPHFIEQVAREKLNYYRYEAYMSFNRNGWRRYVARLFSNLAESLQPKEGHQDKPLEIYLERRVSGYVR